MQRWEQELAFDDIKTSQLESKHVLRSRSPEGVEQEIWGILLAYNLIRVEMEAVALQANVPPSRVSFLKSLRLIVHEWFWRVDTRTPGAIPKHLREMREKLSRLILSPRRKRSYPRVARRKPHRYPAPRAVAK